MKKETIKIKVDQTKVRNEIHFQAQLNNPSHTFKPKKGKGSFRRNKSWKRDY